MEAYKITFISIATMLLTASCGFYVPKSQYDQLESDYRIVRESLDMTQDNYLKQAEALDKIFTEMSSISRSTIELRGNIEQGNARLTQVEIIEKNIDGIKNQLDRLNELEQSNERFKKVVSSLRNTIKEKEAEIYALRSEIETKTKWIEDQESKINEQANTINSQGQQISEQLSVISRQREILRKQVREQAALLYEAGAEFEKVADDSPDVSFKKNKSKVENWQREMYQNALTYYTKAQQYGYPSTQAAIQRVMNKMK